MGISACIIAKNEEANIERCLKSLKGAVNEIIVVDTGSTDKTIEIAKKHNAKVYSIKWEDDFSKARNYSLDMATETWALVIDCDEELTKESIPILKDLSTNKEFDGFGVIISNIIGGHESYVVQSLRFFKNKKEYRFHSPIHEQVGDCIVKAKGPYSVLSSKIKFIHYGYEHDEKIEKEKTIRNLTLLNKVKEEHRDSLYYLHLGNEYVRANDYEKARTIYMKSLNLANKETPHYTQLCHKLVEVFVNLKDFQGALAYSTVFLKEFPDFKAMLFINAISNIETKNYKEALLSLKKYKKAKNSLSKYPNVDYESYNDIDNLISQLEGIIERNN